MKTIQYYTPEWDNQILFPVFRHRTNIFCESNLVDLVLHAANVARGYCTHTQQPEGLQKLAARKSQLRPAEGAEVV
jgi:hypothetical protein